MSLAVFGSGMAYMPAVFITTIGRMGAKSLCYKARDFLPSERDGQIENVRHALRRDRMEKSGDLTQNRDQCVYSFRSPSKRIRGAHDSSIPLRMGRETAEFFKALEHYSGTRSRKRAT